MSKNYVIVFTTLGEPYRSPDVFLSTQGDSQEDMIHLLELSGRHAFLERRAHLYELRADPEQPDNPMKALRLCLVGSRGNQGPHQDHLDAYAQIVRDHVPTREALPNLMDAINRLTTLFHELKERKTPEPWKQAELGVEGGSSEGTG